MTRLLVNIDVDDLVRATDFYVSALELRVGRRIGDSIIELLGAGVPIYLLEKKTGPAFPRASIERDYQRHWTPIHLDVVVDDLELAIERAERAGAKRETDIRHDLWGSIVTLRDPFGHGLCLIRFSERGYDALVE